MSSPSPERLSRIELLVLDVDGVLTDGMIIIDDHGVESKHFHVRDGAAIAMWNQVGHQTAILSGRSARCVDRRAADLGILPVIQGSAAKGQDLDRLIADLKLPAERVAYMGDDLADLPAMAVAGFATCPADAAPEVRERADFVTQATGGRGAVRELIETILKAQRLWPSAPPTEPRDARSPESNLGRV